MHIPTFAPWSVLFFAKEALHLEAWSDPETYERRLCPSLNPAW